MLRQLLTICLCCIACTVLAGEDEAASEIKSFAELSQLIAESRNELVIELEAEVNPSADPVAQLFSIAFELEAAIPVMEREPINHNVLWQAMKLLLAGEDPEPVVEVEEPEQEPEPEPEPEPAGPTEDELWALARAKLDLKPKSWITASDGSLIGQMPDGSFVKKGQTMRGRYDGKSYRWTVIGLSKTTGISIERLDVR